MDASQLQSALDEAQFSLLNIQATRYLSAAGLVALLYDHALTFDDEVEYVWKARWSLAKVLFLILRYIVTAAMIIHTYQMSGLGHVELSRKVSVLCCKGWLTVGLYIGISAIAISNFIVLLRVSVIWDRNARLLLISLVVFAVTQVGTFVGATYLIVHWMPEIYFIEEVRMCGMTFKPPLAGLWAPGLLFEVMVFSMTLWNAVSRPMVSPITYSLYRDGLGYFIVLTIMRLLNLVLSLVAPISLMFLGMFFIWSVTTVTVTRLVLNFRKLSAAYDDPDQEAAPHQRHPVSPDDDENEHDKYSRVMSTDGSSRTVVAQEGSRVVTEEYELSTTRTITR